MNEKVISKMIESISSLVGGQVALVGSVGMGIDISTSDLDLAISVENMVVAEKYKTMLIQNGFEFRGERPSTYTTTRYLLSKQFSDCFVDIVILLKHDFEMLVNGIANASTTLTSFQKKQICEEKRRLEAISCSEYEEYKLKIYTQFCPGLLWLTDIEICKLMLKQARQNSDVLPTWLVEKASEYGLEELL